MWIFHVHIQSCKWRKLKLCLQNSPPSLLSRNFANRCVLARTNISYVKFKNRKITRHSDIHWHNLQRCQIALKSRLGNFTDIKIQCMLNLKRRWLLDLRDSHTSNCDIRRCFFYSIKDVRDAFGSIFEPCFLCVSSCQTLNLCWQRETVIKILRALNSNYIQERLKGNAYFKIDV